MVQTDRRRRGVGHSTPPAGETEKPAGADERRFAFRLPTTELLSTSSMNTSSSLAGGWSQALARAAEAGDAERVGELLAGGAPADARLEGGATALMRAAARGYADVARVLLDAGADVNARRGDGFTPLVLAVFFGHEEVVRLLVGRGADVSARTRLGITPRDWAASRGFKAITELLDRAPETPKRETVSKAAAVPAAPRPAGQPAGRPRPTAALAAAALTEPNVEDALPPRREERASQAYEALPYEPRFGTEARGFAGSWQASVGVVLLAAAVGLSAYAVWRNTRGAATPAQPQASTTPAAQAAQPPPAPAPELTPLPSPSPFADPLMQEPPGSVVIPPYPYEPPTVVGPDAAGGSSAAPSVISEGDPTPAESAPRAGTREPRGEAPTPDAPAAGRDEPRRTDDTRPEDSTRRERPSETEARPPVTRPPAEATPDPSATPRRRVIPWPPQEK